jgi:DNA polymerase-3 subunit delta'
MSASTPKTSASALLPLPQALVEHHRDTFEPWMQNWRETGRVAPVLLLTGPSGTGKREMAFWLSQWLLCERNGPRSSALETESSNTFDLFGAPAAAAPEPTGDRPLEPCGQCTACMKALRGSWVDFTELAPDESRSLKIEEFRRLRATLGFGAFDGAYRITLIREADRLTPQAANSLLKTLEEPPPGFIFLLTASDPSLLLPTLVSRCQRVRLQPLTSEVIRTTLEADAVKSGVSPQDLERVLRFAQGNLARARAALQPEFWEKRRQLLRFMTTPWSDLESIVTAATREPEDSERMLDHLESIARDLAAWSCTPGAGSQDLNGLERELRPYVADTLKKTSLSVAREFWLERAERAFQARADLLLPLNKKLLFQEILLPWAKGPEPQMQASRRPLG